MRLPKPLYESLPVLYVSGGIAAITAVDSFTSFVSGVLMGISGVVILVLRRNHRARPEPVAAARQAAASEAGA